MCCGCSHLCYFFSSLCGYSDCLITLPVIVVFKTAFTYAVKILPSQQVSENMERQFFPYSTETRLLPLDLGFTELQVWDRDVSMMVALLQDDQLIQLETQRIWRCGPTTTFSSQRTGPFLYVLYILRVSSKIFSFLRQ